MTKAELEKIRDADCVDRYMYSFSPLSPEAKERYDLKSACYEEGFNAAVEILWTRLVGLSEALNQVSDNPYIQYGHGSDKAVSKSEHQYKMGVTDGHRLAKTWADKALKEHGVSDE